MNGTENLGVWTRSIDDLRIIGILHTDVLGNKHLVEVTDPFDTQEEAERVLSSWRNAEKMIEVLDNIYELCIASNQKDLAIKLIIEELNK